MEEAGKEYEAEVIGRLDDKVWATQEAAKRGLTYDDVSLTSILSKPAEAPAPAPGEAEEVEDEPASQEEADTDEPNEPNT
jgi:hypothetical protein